MIKLHEPTFGEEEIAAAVDVLRSTYVTSGGKVREMEDLFGPNSVMCNSGSSANLLAVAGLCNPMFPRRMVPGDEVIVSALSWSTTVWPLIQHGLVPVIVDIDPRALNMDMAAAGAAIKDRTRAVMPVHVYGNPCDLSALGDLARRFDLLVVEDCCEALGATVCSVGDVGTYSFYFSHHITTLEGGMCVTRDEELAEIIRMLRAHGWTRDLRNPQAFNAKHPEIDPRFLFVNLGYNLRATEVAAAIGLVQMRKLDKFLEIRRAIAARLREEISRVSVGGWVLLPEWGDRASWFGFPVTVGMGAPFTAKSLRAHLEAKGIETRSVICGNIARQPAMQAWPHRTVGSLEHADHVMREGFSIGCHQNMTDEDCETVGQAFEEFFW
jgi:CDP-4-dehydro-6-deoxyglucose reductase, E1